jgi:hypothetical protein
MYYYCAGLVVPDVPLEETDILRSEAAKNNLELVGPISYYNVHFNLLHFSHLLSWTFFGAKRIKSSWSTLFF